MKSIITPKNAICTLFCIEILISLFFICVPNDINPLVSNSVMLVFNIILFLTYSYLSISSTEYKVTIKQKIGLFYLATYTLFKIVMYNLMSLINTQYTFNQIIINNYSDATIATTVLSLIQSGFFILMTIAFLLFIRGLNIEKKHKNWLTFLYFVPIICLWIWIIIFSFTHQEMMKYQYIVSYITTIVSYAIMIYIILKAYTIENNIE